MGVLPPLLKSFGIGGWQEGPFFLFRSGRSLHWIMGKGEAQERKRTSSGPQSPFLEWKSSLEPRKRGILSLCGAFGSFDIQEGEKRKRKEGGAVKKEKRHHRWWVPLRSPPQQPPPSHRSQEVRTKPALSFPEGPFLHSKGEVGHAKGKTRRGTNENIVEKVDRRRGRKRDRGGGEKYRAGCRFCSLLRYSFAGGRRGENAATQKGAFRQKCRKGTVLTICHQTPVRSFARGGDVPFLPDEKERGGVGVGETS